MTGYIVARRRGGRLRFTLRQLLGVVTWLAGFLAAWRTAVTLLLIEYSKLPTEPINECYVCSAAAKGHPCVVGSRTQTTATGKRCCVNDQMRYLKAAELAWAIISPRTHRAGRWLYDRLGPVLAGMLSCRALADLAYLSLKPGEWLARVALAVLLPGRNELVRTLYRGPS
jgi:hypothetical protein